MECNVMPYPNETVTPQKTKECPQESICGAEFLHTKLLKDLERVQGVCTAISYENDVKMVVQAKSIPVMVVL